MDTPDKSQISRWLTERNQSGQRVPVDEFMEAVYPELRRLAYKYFRDERAGHTLQPTALVHEAYIRLVDQTQVGWEGRSHFLAIAAKVMRRILIDHARGRARQRRVGDRKVAALDSEIMPTEFTEHELLEINDAIEKLAALDARQAQVVEMRFFGGMTVEEVATAIGVSKRTIEDDWKHAKAWLKLALAEEADA